MPVFKNLVSQKQSTDNREISQHFSRPQCNVCNKAKPLKLNERQTENSTQNLLPFHCKKQTWSRHDSDYKQTFIMEMWCWGTADGFCVYWKEFELLVQWTFYVICDNAGLLLFLWSFHVKFEIFNNNNLVEICTEESEKK